ncbi:MAG: hypothetical protein IH795_07450 [Bacteroidetes bacterium]|nr:hypothetical protein [Bacteroidota bacterium]
MSEGAEIETVLQNATKRQHHLTTEEKLQVVAMLATGTRWKDIEKAVNVCSHTVNKINQERTKGLAEENSAMDQYLESEGKAVQVELLNELKLRDKKHVDTKDLPAMLKTTRQATEPAQAEGNISAVNVFINRIITNNVVNPATTIDMEPDED